MNKDKSLANFQENIGVESIPSGDFNKPNICFGINNDNPKSNSEILIVSSTNSKRMSLEIIQ